MTALHKRDALTLTAGTRAVPCCDPASFLGEHSL